MLRDLLFAIHDIKSSLREPTGVPGFYWNDAPQAELSALITHLSNTEDDERRVIRHLLGENRTTSLLDVGCGPATELSGYKKYNLSLHYTGIDRSATMLREARKRHPEATFYYGDAQQLPFKDGSFDTVLLKHLLEHLPTYEPAVVEAIRVSKRLVIIDFFHHLQLPFDVKLKQRGYWNNWYSKGKFENFISKKVHHSERITAKSTSKKRAEIYILFK
jgi:ubiquinone/menaquinone biosynthesis C-methylase UbiE